jgi:hypothetical protein
VIHSNETDTCSEKKVKRDKKRKRRSDNETEED